MASNAGPKLTTSGLILELDASNRKSYMRAVNNSILNVSTWAAGQTDGVGMFYANGSTGENARVIGTDPWGNSSVVWETRASGNGQDDGGWNTATFDIDKTKLYRFSVWVKRTSSSSGGTFYLGTGSNGGVFSTQDGGEKGNPYWECSGTGKLVQNQWYLVCGHIYPFNTTHTGNHPNTGFYTISGGTTQVLGVNFCNIVSDLKWGSGSTWGQHRCYHYYCGDSTTRLHFAEPRVDVCDGTEPSISDLLNNGSSIWKDSVVPSQYVNSANTPAFTQLGGVKCFRLSAQGQKFTGSLLGTQPTTSATIEMWVYPEAEVQSDDRGCMLWIGGGQTIYMSWNKSAAKLSNYWYGHPAEGYHESGATVNRNTWNHFVAVWDYSTSTIHQYTNGVKTSVSGVSGNAATGSSIQIGQEGASRQFAGGISNIKVYNRALSTEEVQQNFQALRSRYAI